MSKLEKAIAKRERRAKRNRDILYKRLVWEIAKSRARVLQMEVWG